MDEIDVKVGDRVGFVISDRLLKTTHSCFGVIKSNWYKRLWEVTPEPHDYLSGKDMIVSSHTMTWPKNEVKK